MTPEEEKAKELIQKFSFTDYGGVSVAHAKKCAVMAVDEVIAGIENVIPLTYDSHDAKHYSIHRRYWQTVKEEINNTH